MAYGYKTRENTLVYAQLNSRFAFYELRSLWSSLIPAIDRQCVEHLLMDAHTTNVTNYAILTFIFDLKCLLEDV